MAIKITQFDGKWKLEISESLFFDDRIIMSAILKVLLSIKDTYKRWGHEELEES